MNRGPNFQGDSPDVLRSREVGPESPPDAQYCLKLLLDVVEGRKLNSPTDDRVMDQLDRAAQGALAEGTNTLVCQVAACDRRSEVVAGDSMVTPTEKPALGICLVQSRRTAKAFTQLALPRLRTN